MCVSLIVRYGFSILSSMIYFLGKKIINTEVYQLNEELLRLVYSVARMNDRVVSYLVYYVGMILVLMLSKDKEYFSK